MPGALIWHYIECLPVLQAEEQLVLLQVADYPHLGEGDRGKLHRGVARAAEMDDEVAEPVRVDTEAGQAALQAIGIKVVKG